MNELDIIKNFDEFYSLNETLSDGYQDRINDSFRNLGVITFANGDTVTPDEIIGVVKRATDALKLDYPRTFYFADRTLNIIYLAHSNKYKTMAVDAHMNMYVNAAFVYHVLKMDPDLVGAIIMHEVFHVVYDHIERSKNWLAAKGKPMNKANWHDTNLAADVEVNQTLVKSGIISEDRLINEIGGIYLKNAYGHRIDVQVLELILDNEEYMNMLREMDPPPMDPETAQKIKTSKDWDSGYKELWNTLVPLIKKYGWEGIWSKLQEGGLINSVGEVENKSVDDIKKCLDELDVNTNAMNFLQVKSFDEFVNESNKPTESPMADMGKTYDDGYKTAFTALVNTIKGVLEGNQGGGGGGGPEGPQIESQLKNEDLEELELPDNDNDDDNDDDNEGGNGLPQNVKQKQKNKPKSQEGNDSDGSGDDQDEPDNEKDVKSASKMVNDLKKKMDNQEKNGGDGSDSIPSGEDGETDKSKSSNSQDGNSENTPSGESGGNGMDSFMDDDDVPDDDELRKSGYSDEDIKNINSVRKMVEQKNSPERLKKVLNDYRNQLKSGDFIGKLLNQIDVESRKYKNIWEDMLKKFLSNKTRRAGKDLNTGSNDWKNKKRIALGDYGIHRQKQAQDPQDVNIYVDVSGSMDTELLEIIAKSLVILAEQNQYSGLNVCPWASNSMGVIKIDSLYSGKRDKVISDIMGAISLGQSKCGGGTESTAVMTAMLSCVEENLKDPRKKAKDDVHVVITDGYISGYHGIENDIEDALFKTFGRRDVSSKAPKNTFWMLYDTDETYRKDWEKEIQKGTLIFINSQTVKNNTKR